MRTKIIQVWKDYPLFEMKLNEEIENYEKYYEIIDIKYSTFYDSLNKQWNYSALLLFRERGEDNE